MATTRTHILDALAPAATGDYQRAILAGRETWSGSSLRGNARKWGGRYAASRSALEDRIAAICRARGWALGIYGGTAQTGPRVLVVRAGQTEVLIGGRNGRRAPRRVAMQVVRAWSWWLEAEQAA